MNNAETNLTTPTQAAEWKGYTIDELKYHRAVALVKLELHKGALAKSVTTTTETISATRNRIFGGTGKKFSGKLKFLNYIIIGYKSASTAINLWNTFKRKRK